MYIYCMYSLGFFLSQGEKNQRMILQRHATLIITTLKSYLIRHQFFLGRGMEVDKIVSGPKNLQKNWPFHSGTEVKKCLLNNLVILWKTKKISLENFICQKVLQFPKISDIDFIWIMNDASFNFLKIEHCLVK